MSKMKVTRTVLFALVITVTLVSLLQVSGNAAEKVTYQALAACDGLKCNDPGDCGTFCFCNNPTDTVGTCYKDEETIQAFLRAQRNSQSRKGSPQQQ
ncbi:MAG TPA: hypothetical protein VIJ02_03075 [Thermoanaerobaculia bacterium]|jgi:hypothetical protein